MKKIYETPLMEIVKMETVGMLALSGSLGDDPAEEPAHGRDFDEF